MNPKIAYLLALFLGACSFTLHKTVFYFLSSYNTAFAVSTIDVQGVTNSLSMVSPVLQPVYGRQLREIELQPLKQQIQSVPLVEKVTLYKQYPSTLKVVVSERKPVAEIISGGNSYMVDTTAQVLPLKRQDGVPVIYVDFGLALDGTQIIDENLVALLLALGKDDVSMIESFSLSRDYGAGFLLKGFDTVFYLGTKPLTATLISSARTIANDAVKTGRRPPKRVDFSESDTTVIGYY
ncbi:MAG: cell division protein FtsQ/DivIB [Brevinema sp.]